MQRYGVSVGMCLCVVLGGCGSKELTRVNAKSIIESSDLYKVGKHRVPLTRQEVDELVKRGYLNWKVFGLQYDVVVTDKGKKYFDSAAGEVMTVFTPIPFSVVPMTPLEPKVVEITGITGQGSESKNVEYRWQWDGSTQPQEVRDVMFSLKMIEQETVPFKLYDDGWRVQWPK